MQFQELSINTLFTFHSFSQEVYRKVDSGHCILERVGDCFIEDENIDEPFSMNQRVFLYEGREKVEVYTSASTGVKEQTDRFQPMSLVKALRRYMKETHSNTLLDEKTIEGIRLGLAWAIAEIMEQATAKDRFTA